MELMADKKYTFLVHTEATKSQIKEAVEKMFNGTKVKSVNTMNLDGKNKEISKEDKDAYIGVYRLIQMVEKGDRKAIGAVMKQGSEVTMRSLLTAARSLNNTGNDMIVDDTVDFICCFLKTVKSSKSGL